MIKNEVHFPTPFLVSGARVAHSHLIIKINVMIIIVSDIVIIIIFLKSSSCWHLLPDGREGCEGVRADEGAIEEGDRKEKKG